MKRCAMLLAAFLLFSGFTLSWDTPTYTDGTAIGPEAQGIFYNVEMDNTVASGNFSGNTWNIPAVPKGTPHGFRVRTVLGAVDNTGQQIKSAWSPTFGWVSPLGTAGPPGNLRVAP